MYENSGPFAPVSIVDAPHHMRTRGAGSIGHTTSTARGPVWLFLHKTAVKGRRPESPRGFVDKVDHVEISATLNRRRKKASENGHHSHPGISSSRALRAHIDKIASSPSAAAEADTLSILRPHPSSATQLAEIRVKPPSVAPRASRPARVLRETAAPLLLPLARSRGRAQSTSSDTHTRRGSSGRSYSALHLPPRAPKREGHQTRRRPHQRSAPRVPAPLDSAPDYRQR
jgi:hypothetical protein